MQAALAQAGPSVADQVAALEHMLAQLQGAQRQETARARAPSVPEGRMDDEEDVLSVTPRPAAPNLQPKASTAATNTTNNNTDAEAGATASKDEGDEDKRSPRGRTPKGGAAVPEAGQMGGDPSRLG